MEATDKGDEGSLAPASTDDAQKPPGDRPESASSVVAPPPVSSGEEVIPRKRWPGWTHPLPLLLLSAALSAVGWGFTQFYPRTERAALRLDAEMVEQAIGLLSPQPMREGQPIYCDTAKLRVVIAHDRRGPAPLLVHSIALKYQRLGAAPKPPAPSCAIDTLAARPFGIALRNTYVLEIGKQGVTGRFIESGKPGQSRPIATRNLLDIGDAKYEVTLKPDEVPQGYDVYVTAREADVYRVWFEAAYDADGARTASSKPFLLSQQ